MYKKKMNEVQVKSLLNGQFEVRTGKAIQSSRAPELFALNSNKATYDTQIGPAEIMQLNQRIKRAFGR